MYETTFTPLSSTRASHSTGTSIPTAGFMDTLAIFGRVVFPTLAKGVIIRRPGMLALAERLDLDRHAIRCMQRLRNKYGAGPLHLNLPGRSLALILAPDDVHRVLAQSPEPFATASAEKTAALAHFEPKNVLISKGRERVERRRYNEEVLDTNRPIHRLAEVFLDVVAEEASRLRTTIYRRGELTWNEFSDTWLRIVRRIVFGDIAAEDQELSRIMAKLRSAANWAFLRPRRKDLTEDLLNRIRNYLAIAEPNSLAGVMSHTDSTSQTAPEHQVPQWLFAFDPAGMTTFRSLALLATHPDPTRQVREEMTSHERWNRPLLRAIVLESLRLWPTAPLLLRESDTGTIWNTGMMPAHTGIVIYTPFFHRDNETLSYADRFSPDLWMNDQESKGWPLIPFSEGPAICPGRHLVLLLSTAMLSELLNNAKLRLKPSTQRLQAGEPMPATLNHFSLRFEFRSL